MTPIQPQMTDERLDRLVRQLLTERADDVAAVAMPAETMTAVVASHVRRGGIAERRSLLLLAAALLIVLAAGAVVVGSGLIRRGPEPPPAPQPVVVPSIDATLPEPSAAPGAPARVFYTVYEERRVGDEGCTDANAGRFGTCTSSRIWMADADGSNARELFPDSVDRLSIVDVSGSGDALIFSGPTQIDGQPVSATHVAELGPASDVLATRVISHEVLDDGCVGLCAFDSEFAFSPDGTRLAYVRASRQGEEDYATVIAIQDVATGQVVELDATRASGPDGSNEAPVWSPDGRQLLFTRESIGRGTADQRLPSTATFLVDADGSNLRQLTDTALFGRDGAWSPDGSMIAFTSAIAWLGVDQFGRRENFNEDSDVYVVRADGSDVRRLTNFAPTRVDRGAPVQVGGRVAGWTREGRIVFTVHQWAGDEGDSTNLPPEVWIMDADGANARQIDGSDVASLMAAGCVDCPYKLDGSGLEFTAFWRPAP
jgi:WD40-like Beta Propeller Repeat